MNQEERLAVKEVGRRIFYIKKSLERDLRIYKEASRIEKEVALTLEILLIELGTLEGKLLKIL